MSTSTLSQQRLGNPLSRFLRRFGSWIDAPLNPRAIPALLLSLLIVLLSLTSANAQTKYTADFSTSPTFDYEGGQTYYKTKTTVSINGVNYLIHNAINADFTWTGSAVSYNPYSGVGLLIEREDQQPFSFYGIDLNYTSVNTDLAHAPWLTVSYQGANGQAAPADAYNETSKNFSLSKPAGLTVKSVQLYFADVATLLLDNLIVGPANTTSPCFAPTLPTITTTRTAICAGTSTILRIQSGSLNDASNWKWYAGSCGGTPVGTGSAIQVSPGSTTTYYVRGEGGCVTPGSCASQQITVNPPFFASLSNNGPLTCAKTSVTLTTTGGPTGATYTYSSGAQANAANPAIATVSQAGPYSVTVTVPGGCVSTASTIVSSNTLAPSISVSPTAQTLCQGQTTSFMATGANSYTWSTGATTAAISANASGTYSVTGVASNGCRATASAPLMVHPLPTAYSVTGGGAYCAGGSGVAVGLASSQTGVNYQLLLNGSAVGPSMAGTGSGFTFPNQTTEGSYTVQATNASTACQQTMSGTASVSINALPTVYAVTGGGAYCAGSNGVAVNLSASQTGVNYQLLRDGNPVGSAVGGTGSALSFGNQTAAGPYTVLATDATTSCQQVMNGSTSVTITPLPDAPSLVTQSGYPYPAGVSTLTISQNTGPVSLTVVGCSGGMLLANGNAASSFTISTANTGTQTYTATCTLNGCTSPAGSFQLTVVPTSLSVLYRDQDYGNTQNNIIKPYLELTNAGGGAIPYGELTVRYWFTSEGNAPPTKLALYYAQLGAVNLKYVALSQPRQDAFGYVEYSFPGGGSLAGGGNSGPIENGIQKTDGSPFNESNDYSYQANYANYTPNGHITAYRNGVIVWGQEPTVVTSQTAVQVYSATMDNPTASQIKTRVELRNTGNVPLPVSGLKLRYYFTSDNNQLANVYVDYADIGAANFQARVVQLASPVNGADSYVELSFSGNTGQLNPLSSLGFVDFRLVRSDYGLLNQANDYSYAANYGNVGLNNRITAYLNNNLVFGTPSSGAAARRIAQEPTSVMQAQLLGNPVVGDQAMVEIRGAGGQSLTLTLVDLQGRPVHELRVDQAGDVEQVSMPLGQSRGTLLLRISGTTQQQVLKVIRP